MRRAGRALVWLMQPPQVWWALGALFVGGMVAIGLKNGWS